jgi:hypothetical protein
MSETQLSPCPDCGEECYFHEGEGVLRCYRCEYCRDGESKTQIIAKHERIAGACEWRKHEERLFGEVPIFTPSCGGRDRIEIGAYCPDCGKKVKVKG